MQGYLEGMLLTAKILAVGYLKGEGLKQRKTFPGKDR
jgi:hypothetical protein